MPKYRLIQNIAIAFCTLLLVSCAKQAVELPQTQNTVEQTKAIEYDKIKKESFRSRNSIPTDISRYEGSLWKDEASWGNLLRDHRARFRGDLVKITNLQEVITISQPKEVAPAPAPNALGAAAQATATAAEILDTVSEISEAEKEQNEVLSSLRSISAYVQSVLPNGNMVIVGEKVDYRQQNTVRYVTTVKGIIRPADVNENNEVTAIKLARFEPKIKRQMQAKALNTITPRTIRKQASILDRLSHIATPRPSPAQTQAAPATPAQ